MSDAELLKLRIIANEGERLDRSLLQALRVHDSKAQSVSRAQLKKLFQAGDVLLDGKPASPSDETPRGSHEITIRNWLSFIRGLGALEAAKHCFLPIVYEDEELLILHKTTGTPSVSLSADETHSASAAALARCPALALIPGTKPLEPGLLHRLDTGTSGLLAFAKTNEELARLRSLWKTPEVTKLYRAIVKPVDGASIPSALTITDAIGHASESSGRMRVLTSQRDLRKIRGKPLPAITHVRSVRSLENQSFDLEIEIETGVMHQIRAHLSSRGWPIVGDRNYRGFPAERLMLHAWKLRLPLCSGATLVLEAALPPRWPSCR